MINWKICKLRRSKDVSCPVINVCIIWVKHDIQSKTAIIWVGLKAFHSSSLGISSYRVNNHIQLFMWLYFLFNVYLKIVSYESIERLLLFIYITLSGSNCRNQSILYSISKPNTNPPRLKPCFLLARTSISTHISCNIYNQST